jgi:hypothetical protein
LCEKVSPGLIDLVLPFCKFGFDFYPWMLLRVLENGFVEMEEIAIQKQVIFGFYRLEIGAKCKLVYAEHGGV